MGAKNVDQIPTLFDLNCAVLTLKLNLFMVVMHSTEIGWWECVFSELVGSRGSMMRLPRATGLFGGYSKLGIRIYVGLRADISEMILLWVSEIENGYKFLPRAGESLVAL
jgi:hypothetical protein